MLYYFSSINSLIIILPKVHMKKQNKMLPNCVCARLHVGNGIA